MEAGKHVTAHKAFITGTIILNNMLGQDVYKYKFERNMAVKTMNTVLVSDKDTSYVIDPNLMFQRLLASATATIRRDNIDIEEAFKHELCSYPPRLFKSGKCLLPADSKSTSRFTDTIKTVAENLVQNCEEMTHRVPWKVGSTFKEICLNYMSYSLQSILQQRIVFDGYAHSTKVIHKQRTHNLYCSNIVPSLQGMLTIKMVQFLSNLGNKQRFVECRGLLKSFLKNLGFTCLAARDDADVLICRTAADIYSCNHRNITVVGDDTDLLVILVHMLRNVKSRKKMFLCVYDIQSVKDQLGTAAVLSILLLNSFT